MPNLVEQIKERYLPLLKRCDCLLLSKLLRVIHECYLLLVSPSFGLQEKNPSNESHGYAPLDLKYIESAYSRQEVAETKHIEAQQISALAVPRVLGRCTKNVHSFYEGQLEVHTIKALCPPSYTSHVSQLCSRGLESSYLLIWSMGCDQSNCCKGFQKIHPSRCLI